MKLQKNVLTRFMVILFEYYQSNVEYNLKKQGGESVFL